ncbi:MAG: hypothetical protein LC111_00860 [Bacteroidia bacterium]|nr:hypothetical protein [Bacteroidia bacterium]
MNYIYYTILFLLSIGVSFAGSNKQANFKPQMLELAYQQQENSLSGLLSELSDGIKPKAYKKAWKNESAAWKDKVNNAADVTELSKAMLSLAENIKEGSYKPSWEKNLPKWTKQVKEARSHLALAGLLKTLYNNLNQEAFNDTWKEKSAQWVETLGKIE